MAQLSQLAGVGLFTGEEGVFLIEAVANLSDEVFNVLLHVGQPVESFPWPSQVPSAPRWLFPHGALCSLGVCSVALCYNRRTL